MNDLPATSVPSAAMAASELRRVRARHLARAFAIWVAVPTLLAVVYYGAIATPEYESVAVLTVETAAPIEGGADRRAAKTAGVLGPELEALREHLLSRPTMDTLAREAGLLRHWKGSGVDFLSRLGSSAGAETAHDYYRRKVSAVIDARGATLTLGVRAFSASQAQRAARALVASAELFLDRLSARAGQGLTQVAEARLAAARAELARARAAAPPPGSDAAFDLDLARDEMRAALAAVENAHVEVARRRHALVVVAEPSRPGEARYPRRVWGIATVFFAALVLMGVFRLLVAVVREHAQL